MIQGPEPVHASLHLAVFPSRAIALEKKNDQIQ